MSAAVVHPPASAEGSKSVAVATAPEAPQRRFRGGDAAGVNRLVAISCEPIPNGSVWLSENCGPWQRAVMLCNFVINIVSLAGEGPQFSHGHMAMPQTMQAGPARCRAISCDAACWLLI